MRILGVSIIVVIFLCSPQFCCSQQEEDILRNVLPENERSFVYFKTGVISGNSFQVGYSRKFFEATFISLYAETITYNSVGGTIWELGEWYSPENWINPDPDRRSYFGIKIGRRMNLSKSGKSSFHLSGGWAYVRDHFTKFDQAVNANLGLSPSELNIDRNNVAFVFTSEFQKWYTENFGMTLGFSGALFDNNKGDFLLNVGATFAIPKKN